MYRRNFLPREFTRPSLGFLFFLLFLSSTVVGCFTMRCPAQTTSEQTRPSKQATRTKEEKEYENQQRAIHLLLMKGEIKALDEADLRCLLRTEIIRFIFENDVRKEFDSAESMSIEFFEDMAKNPDQISLGSAERWGNMLLQSKAWRLVAEQVMETERKYPMPRQIK